jgi:hypothetical protein
LGGRARAVVPVPGGPSARSSVAGCSSCSSRVLALLCFDLSGWAFSVGVGLPNYPCGSDCPRGGHRPFVFRGAVLVVRVAFSNHPP